MIKTNIKMRVMPEQSARVQEICFKNGIDWKSKLKGKTLTCINEPFIFVKENKYLTWLTKGEESDFMEAKEEEIDPELFIRTNGTCIEEKQEFTYPMWFKYKNPEYVVRFDDLTVGEVVYGFENWYLGSVECVSLTAHTDNNVWVQVPNPDLVTDKEIEKEKSKETLSNMIKQNGGIGNPNSKLEWIDFEDDNKAKNPNKDECKIDNSKNNGGKTDYYQLENAPFKINDFDDFAEWRGLNGNQFNMGKVAWTFNAGRHSGTDYERDLNKIIHYANRELLRLKRDEK